MGHYDDSYTHTADEYRKACEKTNKVVLKKVKKLTDQIRYDLMEAEHDGESLGHAFMRLREFEFWVKEALTNDES